MYLFVRLFIRGVAGDGHDVDIFAVLLEPVSLNYGTAGDNRDDSGLENGLAKWQSSPRYFG